MFIRHGFSLLAIGIIAFFDSSSAADDRARFEAARDQGDQMQALWATTNCQTIRNPNATAFEASELRMNEWIIEEESGHLQTTRVWSAKPSPSEEEQELVTLQCRLKARPNLLPIEIDYKWGLLWYRIYEMGGEDLAFFDESDHVLSPWLGDDFWVCRKNSREERDPLICRPEGIRINSVQPISSRLLDYLTRWNEFDKDPAVIGTCEGQQRRSCCQNRTNFLGAIAMEDRVHIVGRVFSVSWHQIAGGNVTVYGGPHCGDSASDSGLLHAFVDFYFPIEAGQISRDSIGGGAPAEKKLELSAGKALSGFVRKHVERGGVVRIEPLKILEIIEDNFDELQKQLAPYLE